MGLVVIMLQSVGLEFKVNGIGPNSNPESSSYRISYKLLLEHNSSPR